MAPKRREPLWVDRVVVDAVHLDMLRTHGGLRGIRDENALESALARPRHRYAYARRTDLPALAASYGYGLARNHPYRDGNKRTAFLVMVVFLVSPNSQKRPRRNTSKPATSGLNTCEYRSTDALAASSISAPRAPGLPPCDLL